MQSTNTAYLARLDHLRTLAVITVVMFECWLRFHGLGLLPDKFSLPLIDEGHVGVTLFMVISGFLFARIAADNDLHIGRFYLNRVLRIYPLYVVVVLLGFSLDHSTSPERGLQVLFALLPISNLYRGYYGQYGATLWSIAVELQFYLLFPFLWAAIRKHGWLAYALLFALLILLRVLVFVTFGRVHYMAYFTLFGCLDAFLIGCATAQIYDRWEGWSVPSFIAPLVLVGTTALIWFVFSFTEFFHLDLRDLYPTDHYSRSWFWIVWVPILSLCFAALLLSYLMAERGMPFGPVWAFIGTVSYSMYVWQMLIIAVAIKFKPYFAEYLTTYGFSALVTFGLIIPFGALSYYVIERPFLQMRVRYVTAPEFVIRTRS